MGVHPGYERDTFFAFSDVVLPLSVIHVWMGLSCAKGERSMVCPFFGHCPAGATLSSPNFGLIRPKREFLREGGDGESPLSDRGRG